MDDYKTYTIVKGDNLTKIARAFGTTVDELVKLNNIENPNLIYAGAELKIPFSKEELEAKAAEAAAAAEAAKKAAEEEAKARMAAAAARLEEEKKAAEEAAAQAAAKVEEKVEEVKEEVTEKKGLFASLFKKKS